jgi:pyruvate/2-oxoglutarate dehydrogenase complex dihydrolipoamide acyltransferase (E2) component
MPRKVIIPPTGQKESHGTIGMWFKTEGDAVKKGESLCTVETEKASVEIEAPCSGILRLIICPRDTEVSVGNCLAINGDADEDITAVEAEARRENEKK